MKTEEWRSIVGFDGYEVSNLGRIKSFKKNRDGRIMKTNSLNAKGYKCVKFWDKNKSVTRGISRVVAEAFIPEYSEGLDVDHINGNKTDNRVENLRMVSHRQNCRGFQGKVPKTSKFRGVYKKWHSNNTRFRWAAKIRTKLGAIHLGSFKEEKSAARAYNKKAIELGYAKEALNAV